MEGTQDTWRLVSLSPLPLAVLAVLVVALVVSVFLASLGVRRESDRAKRWVLFGLRSLAVLCAIFFLVEPAIRKVQVARLRSRVAVLVDRSASMAFKAGKGEETRAQQVAGALKELEPQFAAVRGEQTFEVFGVEPELSPTSAAAVAADPGQGKKTDLLAALKAAAAGNSSQSRRLAGVILFSDGADNADLGQGIDARSRRALQELGVPVTTFIAGKEGLSDVAIENVKVDDFAFVRNSVTAEIEVHGRGFGGDATTVVLRREGQVVATKAVKFASDDDVQTVSFTFTPDQTGRFVYTVATPVFPDEAVSENNSKTFALKVIRDRTRVLLVAGRPAWDERFLRGLFKQDPNVELISFYILRNNADNTGAFYEDRELSLIPFPINEIFREKLNTFDVVVFLNFGYTEPGLSISQYERDLKAYVNNGGAVMVVGGDRSFGESRYAFHELGEALPVEAAGSSDPQPFTARLTKEGQAHPVTALGQGGLTTDQVWAQLPPIQGINLTRAKPGATVLLDAPFANGAPVLALWEYGRGRSAALTSDATWSWALGSHKDGSPNRHFERFWGNLIRWLVRDPDLTTLQVTADPATVEPGKPVGIAVVARSADYQPAADAELEATLLSAEDGKVIAQQNGKAGPDGTAHLDFPAVPPGAYKINVKAKKGDKPLGETQEQVAVRAVGPELADARVGTSLMEQIASATNGKSFQLPASPKLADIPLLEPPLVEVGRSRDQPIWDRWYWLVALITVIGLEWALRRRFGYV